MQSRQFQSFLGGLHKLSPLQVKQLRAALDENDALLRTYSAMQEATGGLCCHHCGSKSVVKNGFENGLQRIRCKECGRSCNCVTGTPLSRLRNKEKFATYAYCLEQGMTLRQAAQTTQLNLDRAFRWRHRFLQSASAQNALHKEVSQPLSEVVRPPTISPFRLGAHVLVKQNNVVQQVLKLKLRQGYYDTHHMLTSKLSPNSLALDMISKMQSQSIYSHQGKLARLLGQRVMTEQTSSGIVHRLPSAVSNGSFAQMDYCDGLRIHDWLQRKMRGVASKYRPNYLEWQRMRTWREEGMSAEQILHKALGKRIINV